MGRDLPAIRLRTGLPRGRADRASTAEQPRPPHRWLGSPLGAALLDATPGVLRALGGAGTAVHPAPPAASPPVLTGRSASEVRITRTPTSERIVIRTASVWTLAPTPPTEPAPQRPGGRALGLLGLGGLLVAWATTRQQRWRRATGGRRTDRS